MRKQWNKAYGKVAYVTALSLILGSGAYFGIGAADGNDYNVVAEAAEVASPSAVRPATPSAVTSFKDENGNPLKEGLVDLSTGWKGCATQDFYLYDGYTTDISFEQEPFVGMTDKEYEEAKDKPTWLGFEFSLMNGTEKGVTLRTDEYFDKTDKRIERMTSAGLDLSTLAKAKVALKGSTIVTVNKTGEKTVEVNVVYANKSRSVYVITHTNAVDLENYKIYFGGNGCKLTFKKVDYTKNRTPSNPTVSTVPTTSSSPVASQTPAASGSPAASQTPAASGSPAASEAPATSDAPAASDAPAVSEAPAESQAPVESQTPAESPAPTDDNNGDDDNNNTNTSKEPEKQNNATAKKQNGITVKADTKANGTATISTVKKTNKATVTIASTITVDGVKYKVTTIGANAFKNCKKATKISLPSTVKTINKNAFAGAKKLKTIKLTGKKAVTVKKGAFKGLNTKKMTVTVNKKMSKKEFNKMKKNLKKAGFKGKVKKA